LLTSLPLALCILVVSGAAPAGLPPAMGFPASERTAQIAPAGVARVGKKEDPTVPTASPVPAQLRLGPQNRAQQHVIREDQRDHWAAPIPIRPKLKMLPDLDCKNPKTWLWTLKLVKAPLALPKQPQVVEAGQGDFHLRPTPHRTAPWKENNHFSPDGSVSVSIGGSIPVSANAQKHRWANLATFHFAGLPN